MGKISGGYFIKARKIKGSAIAHSPPYVRELWDYLLREANHKDAQYNGFTIKRGQLFKSYKEIRDDLCWYVGYRKERYNENHMKMGMRYLTKQLMITSTKQPRGNLITVLNYDYYQNPKNYETTKETTNEATNGQPMDNQSVPSINKNVKNAKNVKNDKDTTTCPHQKIIEAYHKILPELSKVRVWNEASKRQLVARWREDRERQSVEWWELFFKSHIKQSDFLIGKKTDFQATLSWIVGPKNFEKIMNGQYVTRGPQTGSQATDKNLAACADFINRKRAADE